ncbi:MAG: aspartate aminotransferase family protein [Rhizobiales bacterium]|nr:aspartate aminotransferase family protein [Hyphomicrobiales bacterium]
MGREKDAAAALAAAAGMAGRYLEGIGERRVAPDAAALAGLVALDTPLPDRGMPATEVLALLDRAASPATMASAGPRYFGFVIGGAVPASLGAAVLSAAWDQNAGLAAMSPAAAAIEEIAARWILDLLGFPTDSGVGFTTGATMANLTALAAARHSELAAAGWDVNERGLFGAPEITVFVGEEVHASLLKALALLGLGRSRVRHLPVDGQGRIRATGLPRIEGPTILCLQAGNVNTGASDPFLPLTEWGREGEAWIHVDGAFGLWALAARGYARRLAGIEYADSWATDAHKWLNVPYDSGFAIVRDRASLHAAMNSTAAYLAAGEGRDGLAYAPEMSRRARGIEVWAAIREMGREGVADLVARCCSLAVRFAEGLAAAGCEVLNDVVLNQVLVAFGDDERTRRVIAAVQRDGTAWCGGTVWQGRAAMRISVSSWATTEEDVDLSLAAILKAALSAN